jgi:hypothetical protein
MTLPPIPRLWRRWALIGGGLAVFLWLRLEDHGVATALLMGLLLTALALVWGVWPRLAGRALSARRLLLSLALTGAAGGLLTALFSALLMLLKNGFHGHLYPDYPLTLIEGTLARAPAWALAGALLGAGAALLLLTLNARPSAHIPKDE